MSDWTQLNGIVQRGYGVASGQGRDPRFPEGTIALQTPIFQKLGLDLSPYFPGTLNVAISPYRYEIQQAAYTFKAVQWATHAPPEDFSFFDCRIMRPDDTWQPGLIYYPHPDTKPEHFQASDILELLTGFLEHLHPGNPLTLATNNNQLKIVCPKMPHLR